MKKLHTMLSPIIGLFILVVMAGCGTETPSSGEGSGSPEKFLVIFSQCNNAEPYRAAQNALLTNLAAEHDDIELVIKDGQQDNSKQIAQIETAIRQKPDLLIVAPNESAPLTKVMGKAMEAGIPTICLERDIKEPNYNSYIKCDNYAIGKMAGEYIVEQLKARNGAPKGKIVELRGLLGIQAETDRYQGAHDVWDQHPEIEVIHESVASWIQSEGRSRMTEMLNAHEQIDVVYGHNDPMAIGAYLAAKEKGREGEMIFVGIDGLGGDAGGIKKVMDGVLAATFYYPLGVDKAMNIVELVKNGQLDQLQETYMMESAIITPENAEAMYKKYTF
ncbi:MAG: substrate-binding domain-containing protein [Candidatus Hydrogenedentes bacterium]|nr:substrate-binding domain-containing protein [Candidatus Hydrogenedentota bacterium]